MTRSGNRSLDNLEMAQHSSVAYEALDRGAEGAVPASKDLLHYLIPHPGRNDWSPTLEWETAAPRSIARLVADAENQNGLSY